MWATYFSKLCYREACFGYLSGREIVAMPSVTGHQLRFIDFIELQFLVSHLHWYALVTSQWFAPSSCRYFALSFSQKPLIFKFSRVPATRSFHGMLTIAHSGSGKQSYSGCVAASQTWIWMHECIQIHLYAGTFGYLFHPSLLFFLIYFLFLFSMFFSSFLFRAPR